MKWRVFSILSILSFVLFLATTIACLSTEILSVTLRHGTGKLGRPGFTPDYIFFMQSPFRNSPAYTGVESYDRDDAGTDLCLLPTTAIILAALFLPSLWIVIRFLPAFRIFLPQQPKHLCRTCRYDLRAHCPGDKCPECGTLIAPPHP